MPAFDVSKRVAKPGNVDLERMARLDCDWYAECARAFASMTHPALEFLPAFVVGNNGLAELVASRPKPDEERWLVFIGQHPQSLANVAGRLLDLLTRGGMRVLYYAFDEASRTMPCFPEIAPYLDVFIHDEYPLSATGRARLRPNCLVQHRSWVANVVPFTAPFVEEPEEKIIFLGSQLGLTDHRKRQIDFLKNKFKDRFIAILDHSMPVAQRNSLARYKVSLCPEGRKFTTPAMGETHTDRPFWSGCLGMVPVSENSKSGDRLDDLYRSSVIERYDWGSIPALVSACERALAWSPERRRMAYDYFNRNETVGAVVAEALHAVSSVSQLRTAAGA
ncbi:MAG TPA: hypothetical protein VKC60_18765 [Opitutaceae bacterium]|nr:hypothetical protein [Opitutaceae bacterium]